MTQTNSIRTDKATALCRQGWKSGNTRIMDAADELGSYIIFRFREDEFQPPDKLWDAITLLMAYQMNPELYPNDIEEMDYE